MTSSMEVAKALIVFEAESTDNKSGNDWAEDLDGVL